MVRSTTRPRYITTTSSAISAMTARSWVMNSIDMSKRCWMSRINSSTCAWMVTSMAVVGSSAISRRGWLMSDMAIITRCRMPPEKLKM